jgi:hypothetical protein
MVNKKECPYCKQIVEFEHRNNFAAHCANCKLRLNYWKGIKKSSQTRLKKRNNYKFNCKKCGKEYFLNLTPHIYQIGKYKKHCSQMCSNSKIFSIETRLKKSIANKKFYELHKQPKKIIEKHDVHERHHGNEIIYKSFIEKYFNTTNLKPQKIIKHWFDFVNEIYIIEFTMDNSAGFANAINRFKTILDDKRQKFLICPKQKLGKLRLDRLKEINVNFISIDKIEEYGIVV